MRRKKDEMEDEVSRRVSDEEEEVPELSEKEQKKLKLKAGVEKRKNAIRKDKVARWGGLILLGLVMFVGFLLWVSGEIKKDDSAQMNKYTNTRMESQQGSVIVK